jgi:hypothetical protein
MHESVLATALGTAQMKPSSSKVIRVDRNSRGGQTLRGREKGQRRGSSDNPSIEMSHRIGETF